MIKTKAIRKIFITTVTMFVLLTVFSIPMLNDEDALRVNFEIKDDKNFDTNSIYLLSENGYLVKSNVIFDSDNLKDKVLKVLNNLIENENSKYSSNLKGVIPYNVKILDVFCGNDLVTIDFSKEILNVPEKLEKDMISAIVYSVLDIGDIKGVSIMVEGKLLSEYPNSKEVLPTVLNKDIGINKEYDINSRDNITSVILYYLEDIDDSYYYVPVTKYLNDSRDKIKIIVEELTTSYIYEDNLMSFLNSKLELVDYREENDLMILNFNEYLFDSNDNILEEVIYTIGYSVFDNYDVSMVMFEVNGKEVYNISRK
ncbi:MAG: GerMN domain-containing protein [Bacilli bacterium]|nr:GerMN domain-containing protein [Bacilli bacterium]